MPVSVPSRSPTIDWLKLGHRLAWNSRSRILFHVLHRIPTELYTTDNIQDMEVLTIQNPVNKLKEQLNTTITNSIEVQDQELSSRHTPEERKFHYFCTKCTRQ
jgi:hypothetical protein